LTAVADADYKGIQVHAGPTAALVENIVLPTATTDSKGDVYFECRVNLAVATNSTLFVGLAEAAATILTGTNLLTQASDYIGFYRLDNGDLSFVSHNDQDGTQYSQVVQTTAQLFGPQRHICEARFQGVGWIKGQGLCQWHADQERLV